VHIRHRTHNSLESTDVYLPRAKTNRNRFVHFQKTLEYKMRNRQRHFVQTTTTSLRRRHRSFYSAILSDNEAENCSGTFCRHLCPHNDIFSLSTVVTSAAISASLLFKSLLLVRSENYRGTACVCIGLSAIGVQNVENP